MIAALLSQATAAGQLKDALEREGLIERTSREEPAERMARERREILDRLENRDRSGSTSSSHDSQPRVVAPPRRAGYAGTVFLVPAGPHGAVDPATGTFYNDIGHGYINSKTGQFVPK